MNIKYRRKYIAGLLLCLVSGGGYAQNLNSAYTPGDTIAALDEVVNVAFQKKNIRDVNGAISTVKGSQFSLVPVISADNAIAGHLSGVIPMAQPDAPGREYVDMYIRGLHTSSGNKLPLILVDNVERDFSQLNLNEIESVTVLKDAAATVIYGGRAANGVLLITTKRGKNMNKQELQLHMQGAMVQPTRLPSYLNSYDYARLYDQAYMMDGNANPFYGPDKVEGYRKVVAGEEGANPYLYPNNDYYDLGLRDFSWQQNYDLSMRGGNEFAQYFVLVGYLQQDGLYKYKDEANNYNTNSRYRRFNVRSNIDMRINSVITASLDMAGRLEYRHQPGQDAGNILGQMAATPANAYPIFNEDGSMGGTAKYTNNIYGMITRTGYKDEQRRLFNATASVNFDMNQWVKGLKFGVRGGFDFTNIYHSDRTIPGYRVYELQENGNYNSYGEDKTILESNGVDKDARTYLFQLTASYDRTFADKHNVSAFAHFMIDTQTLPGNVPDYKNVLSGANLSYNYMHKYYIDLTAGHSGTEIYARGSRFRFYPAVAVGWALSEENFLKDNSVVNYLKIRASYGKTGLDRVGDRFLYRDVWGDDTGYAFGPTVTGQNGQSEKSSANPNLHGETAFKMNIGIDGSFFNNRLYLTADYFTEKREDIFLQRGRDIPGIFGVNLPYENLGRVDSKGVEVGATFTDMIGKDFSYVIGANFMYTTNKVKEMYEEEKDWYRYAKGHPLNQQFGLICDGFVTKEDLTDPDFPEHTFGTLHEGDLKYKDLNNDGIVDGNDKTYIGKSDIPEMVSNVTLGFTWKNFEVSLLFQGMFNKDVRMPSDLYIPFNKGTGNATKYAFDCWTPETASTAKYPRLSTGANSVGSQNNNGQDSDFWIMSGDFVRLKNAMIAYNLPKSWLKSVGIDQAKVYLSGYNLLTLDGVKDFDPEIPFWTAFWKYPNNRTYSFGVNVTF